MLLSRRSVLTGAAALLVGSRPALSAGLQVAAVESEPPGEDEVSGPLPARLGWDEQRWPVAPLIRRTPDGWTGGLGSGSFVPSDHPAFQGCLTADPLHCGPLGDDRAGDGTIGRPFRSIWRAQQAANVGGQPARIIIAAGLYDRSHGFTGGKNAAAAVDTMYVAAGGRATISTHDSALSWSPDPLHLGCFVASGLRDTTARVVDLAHNPDALHSDLVPVTTAAELVATPMSYLQAAEPVVTCRTEAGSTTVVVDRDSNASGWASGDAVSGAAIAPGSAIVSIAPDGRSVTLTAAATRSGQSDLALAPALRVNRGGPAVTQENTRVYGTRGNYMPPSSGRSAFFLGAAPGDGFDLEGGALAKATGACLLFAHGEPGDGSSLLYARACSFRYAGARQVSFGANGVQINNMSGLAIFEDCDASANKSDGFNYHDSRRYGVHGLLLNCTAADNGLPGSISNNGMTCHEDCRVIVLGGELRRNAGCSWHAINESRALLMGLVSRESRGDVAYGGKLQPCEVAASDEAVVFAWSVAPFPDDQQLAFSVGPSAVIHRRDCIGGAMATAGAMVDDFPSNAAAWEPVDGAAVNSLVG